MTLYERHRKLKEQLNKAVDAWEQASLELEELTKHIRL
jgi:hypothetical protein